MALHPIIMPKQGAYTEDVILLEWLVPEGGEVGAGAPVFTAETDKAQNDVEADAAGFVHRTTDEGESVPIGFQVGVLAETRAEYEALLAPPAPEPDDDEPPHPFLTYLGAGGAAARAGGAETQESDAWERPRAARDGRGDLKISPRARALLAARGLPLAAAAGIAGTGQGGRITDHDVVAQLDNAPPPAPDSAVTERIPLRGIRGTIAGRMLESLQTTAQLTSILELDVTPVEELRRRMPEGARPGMAAIFAQLVARALREHPLLNARIADGAIELLADINLSIAVETPTGVIAPVVRGADALTLEQLSERIAALAAKARSGSLGADDLTGGTFSLSNGGIHPVDVTTAILNPPQVAILWLGRARLRALVVDGAVVPRPALDACLTYDHRAVDGGPAAAFLGTLARLVSELPDQHPA